MTKLIKEDVKVGNGPVAAKEGDSVWVWYTGKLPDGKIFDSNEKPKPPVRLTLQHGPGGVIDGWLEGMLGMKSGGERKLSVPSAIAYGAEGSGAIPPNTDIYFDIKLAYVVEPGKEKVFDLKDEKVGTGAAAKQGSVVRVNYKGYDLNDSLVLDKSDPKSPDSFTIGKGEVIQGLEYGVIGMKVGGRRILMLPPDAAFGGGGSAGGIAPFTPIRLDVELLSVK